MGTVVCDGVWGTSRWHFRGGGESLPMKYIIFVATKKGSDEEEET